MREVSGQSVPVVREGCRVESVVKRGMWGFGIAGGCVVGFVEGWGPQRLWWGWTIGLAVTALLLVWRFHIKTWRLTRRGSVAPPGPVSTDTTLNS